MAEGIDAYHQAIKMTSGLLRRNSISEDASHYVNEAYLQLAEAGKDITAETLYNKAREIALTEVNKGRHLTKETMKVCPKCKDEFPVGFFGLCYDKKLGRKRLNGWCKNCKQAWQDDYNKKNKERINQWHRAYDQRRYTKEAGRRKKRIACENLYYSYVKCKLKQQGYKNEEITPELIEQTRQGILAKRAKVKKSRTRILASAVNNHS